MDMGGLEAPSESDDSVPRSESVDSSSDFMCVIDCDSDSDCDCEVDEEEEEEEMDVRLESRSSESISELKSGSDVISSGKLMPRRSIQICSLA